MPTVLLYAVPGRSRARKSCASRFARTSLLLLGLLACAAATLAAEPGASPSRAESSSPARFVLVKAQGLAPSPQAAEQQALNAALNLAAQHLKALGGMQALVQGPEGRRVITLQHSREPGTGLERTVLLVELRLLRQDEPLPEDLRLPVLRVHARAGQLTLSANETCEAVAALAPTPEAEPEYLPGAGQTFHLTAGHSVRHHLPRSEGLLLSVLACTGGMDVHPKSGSATEAFKEFRSGVLRSATAETLYDCIELHLGRIRNNGRALRPKDSETPINMTGAAGRESSLPVLPHGAP